MLFEIILFDWHRELAELVYSGNTQLHGFNDPPVPVSVHGLQVIEGAWRRRGVSASAADCIGPAASTSH